MQSAAHDQPTLRFWVTSDWEAIRIEWLEGVVARSASASLVTSPRRITWDYSKPPAHLAKLALECIVDENTHGVLGCEFVGFETYRELDRQVAARCTKCGVVQETEENLSDEHGECPLCFIARSAA